MSEENTQQPINHADMVRQLAKSGDAILATLNSHKVHLWHMAVVIGEVAELTISTGRENSVEELGDIEFYLEGIRQGLAVDYLDVDRSDIIKAFKYETPNGSMVSAAGDVLDQIKKYVIYNKDLNLAALVIALGSLEYHLESFRQDENITYQETLDHNVAKLGARYKGHNYSDEAAQLRADKSEEVERRFMVEENDIDKGSAAA